MIEFPTGADKCGKTRNLTPLDKAIDDDDEFFGPCFVLPKSGFSTKEAINFHLILPKHRTFTPKRWLVIVRAHFEVM